MDFKIKHVTLGGKKLKLAIWDTGNELCYMVLFHLCMEIKFIVQHCEVLQLKYLECLIIYHF